MNRKARVVLVGLCLLSVAQTFAQDVNMNTKVIPEVHRQKAKIHREDDLHASEFDVVRVRLAALLNERDSEQQIVERPTLRRRTAIERDSSGGSEERPN
jgi:hypothetical protein